MTKKKNSWTEEIQSRNIYLTPVDYFKSHDDNWFAPTFYQRCWNEKLIHTFQTIPWGYCCTPGVNLAESMLFSGVLLYPKIQGQFPLQDIWEWTMEQKRRWNDILATALQHFSIPCLGIPQSIRHQLSSWLISWKNRKIDAVSGAALL